MKRVLSLFLSVVMLFGVVAGLNINAYALPCAHENYHYENQVAATVDTPGYSGDKVCDDCSTTFETGETTYLSGWVKENGNIYYIDSETHTKFTGLQKINDNTYYFDENGVRKTGRVIIDGNDYYFYGDGTMAYGGWKDIGKDRYYFTDEGVMLKGFHQIGDNKYYFKSNGQMLKGWLTTSTGSKYYFKGDGRMTAGCWLKLGNDYYYFLNNGQMKTGWQNVRGVYYYLNSDGKMAKGWKNVRGTTYYLGTNGQMRKGWQTIDHNRYYFGDNGQMRKDWVKINGKWNFFGNDGIWRTGFVNVYATYTSSYVKNANRTNNLAVASKAISGTIVKPGATFNFNSVVGPRTSARGYKTATVFTGTKGTAQELGGGICQVASTMFNTCLLANVKIVERHQHSQRVHYVPLGRDAAISGSAKNFRWTNNTGYTIKVEMTVSGGYITCTFYTVEHVSPAKVSLNVSRSGNNFTLKRSVNGTVNYTTRSNY